MKREPGFFSDGAVGVMSLVQLGVSELAVCKKTLTIREKFLLWSKA